MKKFLIVILLLATTGVASAQTRGIMIGGIEWATRNLDAPGQFAATPEAFGQYYQFGYAYGWSNTEPRTPSTPGRHWVTVDENLEYYWPQATDPCPEGWRLPYFQEMEMLCGGGKVENVWTEQNGVAGRLFTDRASGASIFLPAAGYRDRDAEGALSDQGAWGFYWSRSVSDRTSSYAMRFKNESISPKNAIYPSNGFSVRCVRIPDED